MISLYTLASKSPQPSLRDSRGWMLDLSRSVEVASGFTRCGTSEAAGQFPLPRTWLLIFLTSSISWPAAATFVLSLLLSECLVSYTSLSQCLISSRPVPPFHKQCGGYSQPRFANFSRYAPIHSQVPAPWTREDVRLTKHPQRRPPWTEL